MNVREVQQPPQGFWRALPFPKYSTKLCLPLMTLFSKIIAGDCHKEPNTPVKVSTVSDVTLPNFLSHPRGWSIFSPVLLTPRLAPFPGNWPRPADVLPYVFFFPLPRIQPYSLLCWGLGTGVGQKSLHFVFQSTLPPLCFSLLPAHSETFHSNQKDCSVFLN